MNANSLITDKAQRKALLGVMMAAVMVLGACGGGGGGGDTPGTPSPPSPPPAPPSSSPIANCPNSDNLIESTQWTNCLEGKILKGKDPLSAAACEVRFLAGTRIEYVHNGTTYASANPATWSRGLYQNVDLGGRLLLGSLSASGVVPNEVNGPDLTIRPGTGEDLFKVEMFDTNRARFTLNCKLDNI
jgi:hypothetical protein